jgi:hypothetical protein
VVYSAAHKAPDDELTYEGGRTWDKILGAHTAPLEHFLLKRKLMGPAWIRIKQVRYRKGIHSDSPQRLATPNASLLPLHPTSPTSKAQTHRGARSS